MKPLDIIRPGNAATVIRLCQLGVHFLQRGETIRVVKCGEWYRVPHVLLCFGSRCVLVIMATALSS